MSDSRAVIGLYDAPMWTSIGDGRMALQACARCGAFRYPPAPVCPGCLAEESEWRPVSGLGVILSWVVFHRTYFDDHPAPYNAIAVRLAEGPIVISNLIGEAPEGSWIGRTVAIDYVDHGGRRQHAFRLAGAAPDRDAPG